MKIGWRWTPVFTLFPVLLTIGSIAGCDRRPPRVNPPSIDASDAGEKAVSSFDKNGDNALSSDELIDCPALQVSFGNLDKNSDGSLTAGEIAARIKQWQDSKVGMISSSIMIELDGQPVVGATTTLEPAEFLGTNVLPASAVSSERGVAAFSVAEEHRPYPNVAVVHCGFYNLRISKMVDGKETIPEKYNSKTMLGYEIAPDKRNAEVVIELESK